MVWSCLKYTKERITKETWAVSPDFSSRDVMCSCGGKYIILWRHIKIHCNLQWHINMETKRMFQTKRPIALNQESKWLVEMEQRYWPFKSVRRGTIFHVLLVPWLQRVWFVVSENPFPPIGPHYVTLDMHLLSSMPYKQWMGKEDKVYNNATMEIIDTF